ncbi:response regulator [Xanthocytophaga agilis]|uniref:Response regulator n=1 Tax=Xanthocytophaga agilis TaxID=3048010 RepID=A0AAE3UIH5_9BACT|nr:response regulator [Xanthocytophaga agilis]MDJ1503733.1 response regulator [Xanthocytophaga agilis]
MNNKDSLLVYLADDDEDDRMFFTDAVKQNSRSIHVDSSTNGEQLLQKVFNQDLLPDVVFLDLNMPRKNGLECLQAIRANSTTQHIPIIIISTSSAIENIRKANSYGANFYIQKPDDFFELKRLIEIGIQFSLAERKEEDVFLLNEVLSA